MRRRELACAGLGEALLVGALASTAVDDRRPVTAPPSSCRRVVLRGAVGRPGVVCLDEPARIGEVVAASGGAGCTLPDPAATVRPGDEVRVEIDQGGRCEVAVRALRGAELLSLGMRLDANRASAHDLEAVPGIGPERAAAMVETRERRGPFASAEDLEAVPGLGPTVRASLDPYLEVR